MAATQPRYRPELERSRWLSVILLAGLVLIFLRLFQIQVLKHDYYVAEVGPRLESRYAAPAPQPGSILARTGEPLAESLLLDTLFADPLFMARHERRESPQGVAQQLAPLIGRSAEDILTDLTQRQDTNYVELARCVPHDVSNQIRALRIKGLGLKPEWKREYPHGILACHLLGGRDKSHNALSGLEYRYRLLLDGNPGANLPSQDPLGLDNAESQRVGDAPGKDLLLTIHPDLQRQVEREMDVLWRRENPKWTACVVEDVTTGGILAMAARPGYDPNDYVRGKRAAGCKWSVVPENVTRNIPVTEAIEQGSTFKILLATAALEAGVVVPSSSFHCGGTINMGGRPISCWGEWGSKGHGNLDVSGMLAQSCNVCAAQIAVKLGAKRYGDFLRKVGIGIDPEAGFSAEAKGRLKPAEGMRKRDLGTMGFGQNVSCSGLQLTSIVSGIVNDGIMKHPHILAAALNRDGTVFRKTVVSEKRICSPQTSATIRKMLENTVENGTGKPVKMPDFRVGGKTGTAQQWDPKLGRYTDRYMMSFIEVAPIEAPRYVIWVACSDPKVGRHGSDTAAPAAKHIAEYALRQLTPPQPQPAP